MMYRKMNSLAMALVLFAISAVGVQAAQTDGQSSTALEKKIYKKIVTLPYYGVFDNIKFKVDDGTVYLTGQVYRGLNRSGAENRIKKLDGVKEVVNDITLLSPSSFDDRIRIQTYRSLFNRAGLSHYLNRTRPSIRIIVNRGRVTLEGFVKSDADKNRASIIANTIPGIFKVTNNLEVTDQKKY